MGFNLKKRPHSCPTFIDKTTYYGSSHQLKHLHLRLVILLYAEQCPKGCHCTLSYQGWLLCGYSFKGIRIKRLNNL